MVAPAERGYHVQYPPEPVLRLYLQRRRGSDRGGFALPYLWHPAFADHRGGGDGTVVGQRGHQRTASQSGDPVNIGGASAATGVSQRMIRKYEKIALIPSAAPRASGYRDCSDWADNWLRFIATARDLCFTLEELRKHPVLVS